MRPGIKGCLLPSVVFVFTWMLAANASAQITCIQTYVSSGATSTLGFAQSDVESIVSQISKAIGLDPTGIKVVPCAGVGKVQSAYYDQADVPLGDYVLYDPVWVREVVGNQLTGEARRQARDEAVFLFGHELGHILGRHFTSSRSLPRIDKELAADKFAGCTAGVLAADWKNIEEFIGRIRGDTDTTYPSRVRSVTATRASFDSCRSRKESIGAFKVAEVGPSFDPPKMNGRTLDACLISPDHPAGDDCSVQASQTIASQFCKAAGYLSATTHQTRFTPTFKASYKLTKRVEDNGVVRFVWNEDDSGGAIVSHATCRN
jgi:hypothetical protein